MVIMDDKNQVKKLTPQEIKAIKDSRQKLIQSQQIIKK